MSAPVLLVLLVSLASISLVAAQGVWCNKPYPPQNQPAPPAIQPNTSVPYPLPAFPSRNFSITPNLQPYTTETEANFFVTLMGKGLTEALLTVTTTTGLQLVAPMTIAAGSRVSVPFNLSALVPTQGPPTTALCAISTPSGRLVEQQVLYLYRLLPNPYNGSTTKIDYSTFSFMVQNITTGDYSFYYPYGFYYNSPWLTANHSNIDLVKAMGVTSLQPVYPYDEDKLVRAQPTPHTHTHTRPAATLTSRRRKK